MFNSHPETASADTYPSVSNTDWRKGNRELGASTQRHYLANIQSISRHIKVRHGAQTPEEIAAAPDPSPLQMIESVVLRYQQKEIKQSVYKAFRSALRWWIINQMEPNNPTGAQAALKTLDAAKPASLVDTPRRKTRTPGRKPLSTEHMALLTNRLSAPRGENLTWRTRAQHFLAANNEVGLRPVEWANATWSDDSKTALSVLSSKVDESRGLSRWRNIPVSMSGRLWVDAHLMSVQAFFKDRAEELCAAELVSQDALWMARTALFRSDYFERCRTAIWRAVREVLPPGVTFNLYATRHAYATQAKIELGTEGAATNMNHVSVRSTAGYGEYPPRSRRTGVVPAQFVRNKQVQAPAIAGEEAPAAD